MLASEAHPVDGHSECTARIPCVLVLQEGLAGNFSNAEVTVEACPDLSQLPWGLAAPGVFVYRPPHALSHWLPSPCGTGHEHTLLHGMHTGRVGPH